MSYVLLSIRKNDKSAFIVRTLIDKLKNELYEIDVYELSAINASNLFNKKGTRFMLKSNEGEEIISVPYLGSKISVSNFLKLVKYLNLANEVFSKDVAEKLNVARHEGTLSKDLRFSLKDGKGDYNCSKGQIAKYVASHSKEKVYSREDAYRRGGLNQTQSEGDKLY